VAVANIVEKIQMAKRNPLKIVALWTAIGLAGFSGTVATIGLARFCPGAEPVVIVMGALFELAKLSAFAMVHKTLPRTLKTALVSIGLILAGLNIVGMSGMLSASYTHRLLVGQATAHAAEATGHAEASLIERQLASAESNLVAARSALIRAKDDKARIRAAKQIVDQATAERDNLVKQLGAAQANQAKTEGEKIGAAGEFAAVAFIAAATGAQQDQVATMVIMIISALPDTLAILLLIAATYEKPAQHKPIRRRRKVTPRRRPTSPAALRIVPNAA
jgi:hypothetical protein